MPTQADVQALQRTNDDITAVVKAEIARFWRSIDVSTPESARVALDAFLPELVRAYGDAAALVAANFYDELRDKAAASGRSTCMRPAIRHPKSHRTNSARMPG